MSVVYSVPSSSPPTSLPPSAPSSTPSSPKMISQPLVQSIPKALKTDYLVVGAGLSSMGFVDELLTQDSNCTIVIVDKQPAPGGHWNIAYPFVKLHQPAASYGVNSEPLGKSVVGSFEEIDINDLANKDRLLAYFAQAMRKFESTGRVRYFPNATYDWKDSSFTLSTGQRYCVAYRKLVTVTSDVQVPAMRPPPFPVARGVDVLPVNALSAEADSGFSRPAYVVIGGGKTATDAVLFLHQSGVPVESITWVVSRDVWYMIRDSFNADKLMPTFTTYVNAALAAEDVPDFFDRLEREELVGRIDAAAAHPTVFRGAVITKAELRILRTLHDAGRIVRLGRVTAVDDEGLTMQHGRLSMPLSDGTLLVDCTAAGIQGYADRAVPKTFDGSHIHLSMQGFWNVSSSAAVVAWFEANIQANERASAETRKNELFYGHSPGFCNYDPASFLYGLYSEFKMMSVLQDIGASAWAMNARVLWSSLRHVPLHEMLWTMFGPPQLNSKMQAFMAKFEAGGFASAPVPIIWRANLETAARRKLERKLEVQRALMRCLPVKCAEASKAQQHAQQRASA